MRRLPKTHKKLPMKKEDEPDFHDAAKISPLPSLEESPLPVTSIMPPMKRPMIGGGARPSLSASISTDPPGAGMDGRDTLLGMSPSFAMSTRLGGFGPYGGMGSLRGVGGPGGMGPLGGVGGPGGIGGMGLGGFGGFGGLGPGAGLGHPQMAAAHLGLNNQAMMGSPTQLERLRRLQQLEAMERHVLGLGQRR